MSDNVRKLSPAHRIPIIIKGIKDGKSFGQIAKECGVNERTIYRDRESIPFQNFFNVLIDGYLGQLKQLETGDDKQRNSALYHKGMLVRAMLKGVIPTKIQAEVTSTSPIILFDPSTAIKTLKDKDEE